MKKKIIACVCLLAGLCFAVLAVVCFTSITTLHVEYDGSQVLVEPALDGPTSHASIDEVVSFGIGYDYYEFIDERNSGPVSTFDTTPVVLAELHERGVKFYTQWLIINAVLAALFFVAGALLLLLKGKPETIAAP